MSTKTIEHDEKMEKAQAAAITAAALSFAELSLAAFTDDPKNAGKTPPTLHSLIAQEKERIAGSVELQQEIFDASRAVKLVAESRKATLQKAEAAANKR